MSDQVICTSCRNNIADEFFCTILLVLITNERTRIIDIKKLLAQLDSYAFNQGYHLSGSQIVLLRPDILYYFLEEEYPDEHISRWYLREKIVCLDCYDEYKTTIPAK